MFTLLKMATTVLIAAGSLFYLGGPLLVRASVAFEEVAQKLQNAHTLSYVLTMESPDSKFSVGRNRENRLGTRSMPPSWPPTRRTA